MSTQEPHPNFSDGPLESQDKEIPDGILMARYSMLVGISATMLREMERLCWICKTSKEAFDLLIILKGIDAIQTDLDRATNDDFQAEMFLLGRLGTLARRKNRQE